MVSYPVSSGFTKIGYFMHIKNRILLSDKALAEHWMATTVGTFSSLCAMLNTISRSDNGYKPAERIAALRNMFEEIVNAQGGPLEEIRDPASRLTALLHLLIPSMDATPRRIDVTATAIRDMYYEAITNKRITAPTDPQPNQQYVQTTLAQLRAWPVGAAQRSVNRFVDAAADVAPSDSKGVSIADVSEYLAQACPYGVGPHDLVTNERIRDMTSPECQLSIIDVFKLARRLKIAYPREQQLQVLIEFLNAGSIVGAKPPRQVPWNAEWRWFCRIVLRRMYANVREKRTLEALHPMAWPFSDVQHDIESIARAFNAPVKFPYEIQLGRHCRVMRCQTLDYIPIMAYTLDTNFVRDNASSMRWRKHSVYNNAGTLQFRHHWHKNYHDVDKVAADARSDPHLSWVRLEDKREFVTSRESDSDRRASPPGDENGDKQVSSDETAAALLETKTRHEIEVRFHAVVLQSIFSSQSSIDDVLQVGEGFSYICALYNRRHETYEHLPPHRMWTILQRDLATPLETSVHFLPVGMLRDRAAAAKADTSQEGVERLAAIVESTQQNTQNARVLLSDKAIGNTELFKHKPSSLGFLIEEKYDGERAQMHMKIVDGHPQVKKFFTRGGYDRTEWYSDVADNVLSILKSATLKGESVDSIVLDGEMVVYDNTKQGYSPWGQNRKVARQQLGVPLNTSHRGIVMLHDTFVPDDDGTADDPVTSMDDPRFATVDQATDGPSPDTYAYMPDAQLCFVIFDILHLNGQDLISMPLFKRRELLEHLFPKAGDAKWNGVVELSRARYGHSPKDIIDDLEKVVRKKGEGLVVKDPFTPYKGGQSTHWQKVKPHSDDVDMVIVGFGFQVSNDLSSTGDPHISSFTVAVKDGQKHAHLLTVCEIPFLNNLLQDSESAKLSYLQDTTAVRVETIVQALRERQEVDSQSFVKVPVGKDEQFTLYAKESRSEQRTTLKWEVSREMVDSTLLQGGPVTLVHYHSAFTNIQVVAHPFLFSYCIAVNGDYRVNEGYDKTPRFTSKLTIRFPRGTLRKASTKLPKDCDSTDKLVELKRFAEEAAALVIATDVKRLHRILPTGLKKDATSEVESRAGTRNANVRLADISKRALSLQIMGFANETDLAHAENSQVMQAIRDIDLQWPVTLQAIKDHYAALKNPPVVPLPVPKHPPRRPASARQPQAPPSPIQIVQVPFFDGQAYSLQQQTTGGSPPPIRIMPLPPEESTFIRLMKQLDTAVGVLKQILRRARHAEQNGHTPSSDSSITPKRGVLAPIPMLS